MAARRRADRSRRGLLVLVVVSLLLLLVATIVGGRERGVQCAPFPSTSAAVPPVEDTKPALAEAPAERVSASTSGERVSTAATKPEAEISVRGFVVDTRLGHNVPFVTVEIRAGAVRERVQADIHGAFATTQPITGDKLEIEVFDGSMSYGVTELERGPHVKDGSTRIAIDIGPTFLVHDIGMRRVQASDAWMLRLVQTPRPLESAGEIAVLNQELSVAVGPDLVWIEVQLRFAREAAFARWPKVQFEPKPDYLPRVEVRSTPRCERGATEVSEAVGLQELPSVQTRPVLVLTGSLDLPTGARPGSARVLIRPSADVRAHHDQRVPDSREVQVPQGSFEVEVEAGEPYSLLAWCTAGEPTFVERNLDWNGNHKLGGEVIDRLLYPSFDPGVVPPEFERSSARGLQLIRARVHGAGTYGLPIVDTWDAFVRPRPGKVLETRYDIESIGIDCAPATLGLSWTQILPGQLVPDRMPSDVVARPHRIEWRDASFDRVRTDAHVTGGPGGLIVTMEATSLAATWTVIPKCPLYFTVWKERCEPVAVRTEDFVERGDEHVASVALRTGWGVALTFVVADAVVDAAGLAPSGTQSQDTGAHKTFSSRFDFLGLPPLPGVGVSSTLAQGESDAHGCVLLRASTWPSRLTLRALGYRLRELRRLPGAGARWIAYMEHDRYGL